MQVFVKHSVHNIQGVHLGKLDTDLKNLTQAEDPGWSVRHLLCQALRLEFDPSTCGSLAWRCEHVISELGYAEGLGGDRMDDP